MEVRLTYRLNRIIDGLIISGILGILGTAVLAAGGINVVFARTEEPSDGSNNNLIISMNAPDYWNSGTISQTVANLNWRLSGLNAMNDDMSAFFIVVNSPSIMNIALPLTNMISRFTINGTVSNGPFTWTF